MTRKLDHIDFLSRLMEQPETDCLVYRGYVMNKGYVWFGSPKYGLLSHQYAYKAYVGELVPGMDVHHTCGNRRCCNPRHLVQLTKAEHARAHHGNQCRRGHGEEAMHYPKQRGRTCRECDRLSKKAKRWAIKLGYEG